MSDSGNIETGSSVPIEPQHSPSAFERLSEGVKGLFGKKEEKPAENKTVEPTPVTALGDNFTSEEKSSLEGVKAKADEGLIGGPDDQPKEPVQNIRLNPQMGDGPSEIEPK